MERQTMTWKMWIQLIEVRLRFVALLLATGFFIGYWDTLANYWQRFWRPAEPPNTIAQEQIEFFCPMHAQVVRAEIGNCPICGMPLSKRAKGVAAELPPNVTGRVTLSPYRVALAGVRTEKVVYRPLVAEIKALGELILDERKRKRLTVRFPGRIEKLFVNFTGTGVQAGDPLAEIYSPALITTFEELLSGASKQGFLEGGLARSIQRKLIFWGVHPDQIDQVLKQGSASDTFTLRSPMDGVVIQKEIVEGQSVEEGQGLFDLANLNILWLMARIYENNIGLVRVGQNVTLVTTAHPGQVFEGTVAYIDPFLSADTRTANVRVDILNTGMKLKPGMFGTARIEVPLSDLPEFKNLLEPTASKSKTIYTCPMHPEVVQDTPGTCKKCGGMTLVETKVAIPSVGKILYSCPMHPEIKDQKPGKCPLCKPYMDMDLEPHGSTGGPLGIPSIPETAVIDTGSRQVVYVEIAPGLFEGRLVTLGFRAGSFFPVLSGLNPGDVVVAAGAFLIDAETRLNPAAGAAYVGPSSGPARKADPPSPPPTHAGHGG